MLLHRQFSSVQVACKRWYSSLVNFQYMHTLFVWAQNLPEMVTSCTRSSFFSFCPLGGCVLYMLVSGLHMVISKEIRARQVFYCRIVSNVFSTRLRVSHFFRSYLVIVHISS